MTTRTRTFLTLAVVALACFAMVTSANAATISMTNSQVGINVQSGNGVAIYGWSLGGGNAIGILYASEDYGDVSATFGGEALTVAGTMGGNDASILYLINPTASSGNVVILAVDGGGSSNFVCSLIALDNVAGLAGTATATSVDTALSVSYTTSTDGGYVLGAAINNSAPSGIPSVLSGNPDTDLYSSHTLNNGVLHTHGEVAAAGAYTDTYAGFDGGNALATVAFNAVPEPSTIALLGLGLLGLAFCGRRRRRR